MAHTKLLAVHSDVLKTALLQYLTTQAVIHPAVAGTLISAVQAHLKDDAADLGGLPPDAHIVGHSVSASGDVSLIIASETFPWTPDGLPLAQMPVFVPTAAKPIVVKSAVTAPAASPAPAGLPSAEDLDVVAAEQELAKKTSGAALRTEAESPATEKAAETAKS